MVNVDKAAMSLYRARDRYRTVLAREIPIGSRVKYRHGGVREGTVEGYEEVPCHLCDHVLIRADGSGDSAAIPVALICQVLPAD